MLAEICDFTNFFVCDLSFGFTTMSSEISIQPEDAIRVVWSHECCHLDKSLSLNFPSVMCFSESICMLVCLVLSLFYSSFVEPNLDHIATILERVHCKHHRLNHQFSLVELIMHENKKRLFLFLYHLMLQQSEASGDNPWVYLNTDTGIV